MGFLLHLVPALELLAVFIGLSSIIVVIGIAASRGKPRTFDREMYWTAFAAAGILSMIAFYLTTKIKPLGVGEYMGSVLCTMLAVALFGLSMGCGIGIFTYRRPPVQDKANDLTSTTGNV